MAQKKVQGSDVVGEFICALALAPARAASGHCCAVCHGGHRSMGVPRTATPRGIHLERRAYLGNV